MRDPDAALRVPGMRLTVLAWRHLRAPRRRAELGAAGQRPQILAVEPKEIEDVIIDRRDDLAELMAQLVEVGDAALHGDDLAIQDGADRRQLGNGIRDRM
jgi:hypothetical protein